MVFKKISKFLCCFNVSILEFIQQFWKTTVFFQKKIEILEIQNFNKIPSLSISFLFFKIFGILFPISRIQTYPKSMKIFVVFYWKG